MDERGLATAVGLAMAAAEAGEDDIAPEADLFGSVAQIDAPRRGRPAGRINRATQEWRDHLLSRHRSPVEFLLTIMETPNDELVRTHGVKYTDALPLRVRCAESAAPYLHKKMPLEASVSVQQLPKLVIQDQYAGMAGPSGGDALTVSMVPLPKQNQGVSEAQSDQSNADQSNVTTYVVEMTEQSGSGIDNGE